MSLAQKGLSGFIYTFSSSIISKIIVLAGGIYLARLLSPEDYGLIAMLYIIFAVSNFMIKGGAGTHRDGEVITYITHISGDCIQA